MKKDRKYRGYTGPRPKEEARSTQKIIGTRRDEATGIIITILAGPPEQALPKAKPWYGIS